jgi:hypothetical protein
MKHATQLRFQLEMGLIEIAHIGRLRPLEDLVAEFSAVAAKESTSSPDNRSNAPTGKGPNLEAARQGPRFLSPATPSRSELGPSSMPERQAPASSPASSSISPGIETPAAVHDPRDFLLRIAAAVGRESLESCMQNLAGARLQNGRVILEGNMGEFVRRQIKENIPLIAQAASRVVGTAVTIVIGEQETPQPQAPAPRENPASENLLDKVKREPVIRSFLDVFPGPVKAEKLDK